MNHFRQLYVWSPGQDDNIGDVVLRRQMIRSIRSHGRLHVFFKDASKEFIEAFELRPTDLVYTRYIPWLLQLGRDALRGRASLFKNPGELSFIGLRGDIIPLPLLLLTKLRGGRVFFLGVGLRDPFGPIRKTLFRIVLGLSDLCYWRDPVSLDYFQTGGVMPDWAFADLGPTQALPSPTPAVRSRIAVSLRDNRKYPDPAWIEALKTFSKKHALGIIVVTQVKRDQKRSEQLAADLQADLLGWGEESHAEQEVRLREIYRQCQLAVSDRLHVLILALAEGASPLCLSYGPEHKVGRHFDAIGLNYVSRDAKGLDADAVSAILEDSLQRRDTALLCLREARGKISSIEKEISLLLGDSSA